MVIQIKGREMETAEKLAQSSAHLSPCKCARPAICTLDYDKYSPSARGHWSDPEPRINRVCTKCWTHWFGPEGSVRVYTRAAWDKWMSSAEAR